MSNIRDFRLKIEKERKVLEKLKNRAMHMKSNIVNQRGLIQKMEAHLEDWQKLEGGEDGSGPRNN